METKAVSGLYHAGQINGTSGYEEAAAQGLYAGLNAVRKLNGEPPIIIPRSEAYLGVLIDDIVTRGVIEPYRLFTSRAEYRLLLRHDNADLRLAHYGIAGDAFVEKVRDKEAAIHEEIKRLENTPLSNASETLVQLKALGIDELADHMTAARLLRRPKITLEHVWSISPPPVPLDFEAAEQVEIQTKYKGYIERQMRDQDKFRKAENLPLPESIDYFTIEGMPMESKERLHEIRPASFGQASRISGVRPSDIAILHIYIEKQRRLAATT